MKEFHSYEGWVDYVLDEEREFSYRSIYDAYLLVQNPRSFGVFFTIESRAAADGGQEYVLVDPQGEYALILAGNPGREAFIEYLISRFSPQERDMASWHQLRHQWHGDDLDSWEPIDEPAA